LIAFSHALKINVLLLKQAIALYTQSATVQTLVTKTRWSL